MKKLVLFISFLIIYLISYSQQYPIKTIIKNDTVFILSKSQFKEVNLIILENKHNIELLNNCNNLNIKLMRKISEYKSLDSVKNNKIELLNTISDDKDSLNDIYIHHIEIQNNTINKIKTQRMILLGTSSVLFFGMLFSIF